MKPTILVVVAEKVASLTLALATGLTFLLWVALFVTGVLALLDAQALMPIASEAERALAPLLVSRDGSEVTFRGAALNTLRICVEPEAGTFGRRVCLTVGDVRSGRVGLR